MATDPDWIQAATLILNGPVIGGAGYIIKRLYEDNIKAKDETIKAVQVAAQNTQDILQKSNTVASDLSKLMSELIQEVKKDGEHNASPSK